jgi:hypothetical protein
MDRDSDLHKTLVNGIPDFLMNKMPINDFPVGPLLDGTDLMPRILPDGRSQFLWDFETFDVLFPLTSGTLIS